ncbi:MAG: hypothetical protein R2693_03810 [Nocardioidaceae bacterium]
MLCWLGWPANWLVRRALVTRLLKAPDIVTRSTLRLLIAFAAAFLMSLSLWLMPAASSVVPARVGAVVRSRRLAGPTATDQSWPFVSEIRLHR